ncbi:MAG: RNA-binding S4 domain-containing protein [Pseudomonadales bacterium]|jgi:ribosome-associated heat shock protein Hsp15|tara:strand:+ start:625 stop:1014 length:390 start_codon:yes stop_codon:yes gene_type:complete
MDKVRIDKWLWAARFYKTRSLAKSAIEGGKVHIDGQKSKPSRMLELGLMLHIRQGDTSKTVEVMGLSEHRRGAPEAELLYRESQESIELREKTSAERSAFYGSTPASVRPNKKQRRQIHRFVNINDTDQ